MTDDESVWIQRTLAGETEAFQGLVERHQHVVRKLLTGLTGQAATADDLAQLTFVTAWQRLGTYRGGSFRAWLCRIAYRHFLQEQRRARATTDVIEQEVHERPSREQDVAVALDELSVAQRSAVLLSLVAGMTHAEVAAATGWPLGTAKSHILRGQARLRSLLFDYGTQT